MLGLLRMGFLSMFWLFVATAVSMSATTSALPPRTIVPPCSRVSAFYLQSTSSLQPSLERKLRRALHAPIRAIIADQGMGVSDREPRLVPLRALLISGKGNAHSMYAVSWPDQVFGVNAPIWILEVGSRSGAHLLSAQTLVPPGYTLGGWGVEVLSSGSERYPEIMIASKGFRPGGGAESEEVCLGKAGDLYGTIPCPATCHQNLNPA